MEPLKLDTNDFRYKVLIGVGGIGAGTFFALNGNHTLGREESRGGHFLNRKDYCKLHIISHYTKALLGPSFKSLPVGKVGDDEVGKRLIAEMDEAGLDVRYIKVSPGDDTLYSICFIYPDNSGGNMTTDDSACSKVDASLVAETKSEFAKYDGLGIVLAVPEVPMEAREALLDLGTKYHFLRAASYTSEEIPSAVKSGLLKKVDLLAINIDEACAAAGIDSDEKTPAEIVKAAVEHLSAINPNMLISITAGMHGSWSWEGNTLNHIPVHKVEVQSTAGAGDAHFSGTIAGLVAGLTLAEAQELGTLVGGLSVTSPHTINKEIDKRSIQAFVNELQIDISDKVKALLED